MNLLSLDVIALKCSSNVKYVPNITRQCFCDETCWTGLLVKKIGGCTIFLTLRVKITSYACLDRSGLKLIFHWKAHSFILSKSSQSCLAVAFGSFINVNKEVSSGKSFGFDWRFSVRPFIWIKKSRGPRIVPCGTPALMKLHDKHWPFSKTHYFLVSRKLINNCNNIPQIPLRRNL